MWQVANKTDYAAERNWVRDKHGAHHWIVAVKQTFDIGLDGKLMLAEEQPPPLFAPEYSGEDGASSLRGESDLGPLKPATDVLYVGHAHAPGDKPVPELPVSLRFADVKKTLLVRGESVLYSGVSGLTTTVPRPFVRVPICYERAYGGVDRSDSDPARHRMYARNPLGVGFAVRPSTLERTPAPQVVFPGEPFDAGPAGFGPIAGPWAPRAAFAGTYDATWINERRPLLPLDYDERFELCAPDDQRSRSGYLKAGKKVEAVNLSRSRVLAFEIPQARLRFTTEFGSTRRRSPSVLSTVLINGDEERVSLVWQTSVPVKPSQVDYLDRTLVEEERGA